MVQNKRLALLLDMLSEDSQDSFLQFAVAKEYEKLGEQNKALKFYNELIQQDPNYVGTYYHLGKLYEELKEFDKSVEIYTQGIQVAQKIGDKHAAGELNEALTILEMDL